VCTVISMRYVGYASNYIWFTNTQQAKEFYAPFTYDRRVTKYVTNKMKKEL
jgi:hypothetical protein